MTEAERLKRATDRGSADAYYSRPPSPHIWSSNNPQTLTVIHVEDMTEAEVNAYMEGYWNEPDRKQWD